MRSKNTIEFLGLWEKLHNSNFKGVEFDSFRNQAGSNVFTMSPTKWIETTGAIGILANLESYNAVLIHQGKNQKERMELLRQLALQQIRTLESVSTDKLPRLR